MKPTVYFVDDDPRAGELFQRFCQMADIDVIPFQDPQAALEAFSNQPCELLISDLKMPGMDGIELLSRIRQIDTELPVILITGFSTVDTAIEALRLGASDFIKKPYDPEELVNQVKLLLDNRRLRRENRQLKAALDSETSTLIGASAAMQRLKALVRKLASIRCNVIIEGESGVGKELVARDLHQLGPWNNRPFVVIDCGALTDNLLESELFGHEKGAFTGADRKRIGRLQAASGGTVFLDEIGNISDAMQIKLLRVVQEQKVTPVGATRPVSIDVRFIVASNRNLESMVAAGEFRHDLFHRLNVMQVRIPPLRERLDDLPLLVEHFIAEFNQRYQRHARGFTDDAMRQMRAYAWPGNVRELRNVVERHVALQEEEWLALNFPLDSSAPKPDETAIDADLPDLATLERRYILKLLELNQHNRKLTARQLGINPTTLWRKLQSYQNSSASKP